MPSSGWYQPLPSPSPSSCSSCSSCCLAFMACLRPAAGDLIRARSLSTSLISLAFCIFLAIFILWKMWCACLLFLISSTRCMALMEFCQSSRSYLTGTFLFFSNSKLGSTASSLPADFLKALVHLALRGFFFFLKFLWHFDLQKLKILQSFLTNLTPPM